MAEIAGKGGKKKEGKREGANKGKERKIKGNEEREETGKRKKKKKKEERKQKPENMIKANEET